MHLWATFAAFASWEIEHSFQKGTTSALRSWILTTKPSRPNCGGRSATLSTSTPHAMSTLITTMSQRYRGSRGSPAVSWQVRDALTGQWVSSQRQWTWLLPVLQRTCLVNTWKKGPSWRSVGFHQMWIPTVQLPTQTATSWLTSPASSPCWLGYTSHLSQVRQWDSKMTLEAAALTFICRLKAWDELKMPI